MKHFCHTRRPLDEQRRQGPNNSQSSAAFTLTELLVVVAMIAMLAAILLPVLHAAQQSGTGIQCLHNHKQLISAWEMYAQENNGKLCDNPALQGNSIGNGQAETNPLNWVLGYEHEDQNVEDNTNVSYLKTTAFAAYCNGAVTIYKCPDDTLLCTEGSQQFPRVRSVSMNTCLEGDFYIVNGNGGYPLDEAYYPAAEGNKYYCYVRLTDIGARPGPAPSAMWVTGDEHADTINNGNMSWFGNGSTWGDTPASYHNLGNIYSFADGHVEYHKWMTRWSPAGGTSGTGLAGWPQSANLPGLPPALGNSADYQWVTAHATSHHP